MAQKVRQLSSGGHLMIIDIECPFCRGVGLVHSPGRNGDPMDGGEDCPRCEGTGSVAHDLNEDADDDD